MGLKRGLDPGDTALRLIAVAASSPYSAAHQQLLFCGGIPFRFMRASCGTMGGGMIVWMGETAMVSLPAREAVVLDRRLAGSGMGMDMGGTERPR